MWIHVACLTNLRGALELDFLFAAQRLVTLAAINRSVRPEQGKLCLRVIKTVYVGPRARVMARFATECGAVRPAPLHAVVEFPVVGILMTGRTGSIGESKRQNLVGSARKPHLVALVAWHGSVRAGEGESSLLMLGDGEKRAMKILNRVAILAAIVIGSAGELPIMSVLVAIHAAREFDFIDGFLTRGNVALGAFDRGVLAFQRIRGSLVLLHSK